MTSRQRKSDAQEPPGGPAAQEDLKGLDFETALEELESLVADMEAGELSLEASLAAFERGVKLTRHCQSALRDAELVVKKLTENDEIEEFELDELDDD
ncbi:MAG: exodeoxyribonuclease VII small subunit [Pseudomonadales bacterium]